jgi:5'-nucleotidase
LTRFPRGFYNRRVHILLTNDDGILAPGLAALYRELTALGRVSVVAPDTVQSASGHGITVREPLVARPHSRPQPVSRVGGRGPTGRLRQARRG